ncbi:NACHT domain-containing protein [Actinophytocola oryzae]|uniref:NACHT domain-containing protein n=1 Tax=Actinophytocola oryzae TaxID=502181 RepID=A0A4R7VFC8_9PSEU|nr:NACHT domain-containing protein [Actinophytocola oryzae]TDV47936.1 NACHT domain-containing protein [Actinophytocola oryzae]
MLLRYLVLLLAVAAVAVVWVRYGDTKVTILVAIMALGVSVLRFLPSWPWRWLLDPRPSTPEQVDAAAEALARSASQQWMAERGRRNLEDAHSMAIRWSVDDRYSRQSVRGGTPVAGDLASVIDDFVARPRRLVVTGDPGSGKTGLCVLLTLELLKSSLPERRVPVLFQMSSWDPDTNFGNWLVRRLVEDYSWLAEPSTYGASACAELLAQQRLLPILDGLDELPEGRRTAALDALQRDFAGRPFVLTCRADEFAAAQGDRLLKDALVVSLLPLDGGAAASYLLDSVTGTGLAWWDAVISRITDEPTSTVGTALTRPLTLFLAQAVYQRADTDPSELLDERRFPAPEDVERRLLDSFTYAAFDDGRPAPPGPGRPARPRRWDPETGMRTLTFLAALLRDRRTRNLGWWELTDLVPRWVYVLVRVVIGSVGTSVLSAVLFGLFGAPGSVPTSGSGRVRSWHWRWRPSRPTGHGGSCSGTATAGGSPCGRC